MRIAIVAANSLEFDSRLRRTATALADDGHEVMIVGFAAAGLADRDVLPARPAVSLVRVALDRRISSAFRPLPSRVRAALARWLGIDPEAVVLPAAAPRGWRPFALVRRLVEITAVVRRTGQWTRLLLEVAPDADVYHAKALIALPVVRAAALAGRPRGARFVYDLADLHTEAGRLARMPAWFRRLVRGREARWIREAAALTAVSDGVADEAVRQLGLATRPTVVMNCPPAWRPDAPQPTAADRLRPAAGLPAERAVVLFQGGFSIDRGIEELVAALEEAPLRDADVAAVFLGYGRLEDWLTERARARPGRVAVLPAVPPDELLAWTASADLGFVGQPPRTLNQRLNLANKLFESLMAGVPAVVATGTEHCRLVTTERVGACADIEQPAALAETIGRLLLAPAYERDRLRHHCRTVALERYTWEIQQAGLVELYRALAAAPVQAVQLPLPAERSR